MQLNTHRHPKSIYGAVVAIEHTLKLAIMNMSKSDLSKKRNKTSPKKTAGNTKVEHDTGKRPEKDTNPLPPNPNKVDNHDD